MPSSLLIAIVVTVSLNFAAGQMSCYTPSGKKGICVNILKCRSLSKLTIKSSSANRKFIEDSRCTNNNKPDQVCCPSESCTTPDGMQGFCVAQASCPYLQNIKYSKNKQDQIEYLRKSRCNGPVEESICCKKETVFEAAVPRITVTGDCQPTVFPPDPNSDCCGAEANSIRIVGGEQVDIFTHPWNALIEYKNEDTIYLLCGGVLISGQYVLTATHCVQGSILNIGYPTNIRLGEYDTSNAGQDCVDDGEGSTECTDGPLVVPILDRLLANDISFQIALLKIALITKFTEFIRPICLPTVDFTTTLSEKVYLYAAGWGATRTTTSSKIKMQVRLPHVPDEDCRRLYEDTPTNRLLRDKFICAGGESGKDTCNRDSGGPLMRKTEYNRYELVGIINFGPEVCGSENAPGVYEKVFDYRQWIINKITEESTK